MSREKTTELIQLIETVMNQDEVVNYLTELFNSLNLLSKLGYVENLRFRNSSPKY